MNKISIFLMLLSILFVPGCSSRQWYETVHQNQRLQCQKVPYSEYAECMERANETYDSYKQKRDEAVKEK